MGHLKLARSGHGVIKVDNEVIVVGGIGLSPTESCKLNGQSIHASWPSMTCTTREPQLSKFVFYPELMLI